MLKIEPELEDAMDRAVPDMIDWPNFMGDSRFFDSTSNVPITLEY